MKSSQGYEKMTILVYNSDLRFISKVFWRAFVHVKKKLQVPFLVLRLPLTHPKNPYNEHWTAN